MIDITTINIKKLIISFRRLILLDKKQDYKAKISEYFSGLKIKKNYVKHSSQDATHLFPLLLNILENFLTLLVLQISVVGLFMHGPLNPALLYLYIILNKKVSNKNPSI